MLGKMSRHELRKPEQPAQAFNTCGAAMKFDFPSRGVCKMEQFLGFLVTGPRPDLSALRMPSDFPFSATDVSEALLFSGGNIRWGMMRRIVVCRVRTVIL